MSDPENFAALMPLIALITDPVAAQARMQELQAAIDASAARKAEADAAHAENDRERERLAELEKSIRSREVKVRLGELGNADDLELIRKFKQDQARSRLVEVGSSGLTREPDLTENAPDPISDRYAEPMGESRGGMMTNHAAKAVRTSPQRPRT